MPRLLYPLTACAAAVTLALFGCDTKPTSTKPDATTAAAEKEHGSHDHGSHEHGTSASHSEDDAKIKAALAELSTADRALAEAQKVCPVTGEALGSMGAPIKVDVKGQAVFICCEGCKEKLLATPDEFLAKLKKS